MPSSVIPSLYVMNQNERPASILLRLTTAGERYTVRITGGCGLMSHENAEGLQQLFEKAFQGFRGAMLFGGTRMLARTDNSVVPGITEVVPPISAKNEGCIVLGVIPRTGKLSISADGLIIQDDPETDWRTIAHPDQNICLVVQHGVDEASPWDAEWQECMRITDDMRQFAGHRSLLVVYNGGGVTERELIATAERGWPVLILAGSGRTADRYAGDIDFLKSFPNVIRAEATIPSFRQALFKLGAIPCASPDIRSLPRLA